MDSYLTLKLIHILSSTILFGTGLGTAYYFWTAHLSGDPRIIASVGRRVIVADWAFTATSGVVQPVTGALLARELGLPLGQSWLCAAFALYVLAFVCWVPVVKFQIQATHLAAAAARTGQPLPARYHVIMRRWFLLGWPAFGALIIIFVLMIAKPTLW
ncbi:MAG TPA: DUF2269 domain-containing protein [Dongiaceae bacterium]|nr:DUF2269 domain-containing protein [Dongiaceae bacterium]